MNYVKGPNFRLIPKCPITECWGIYKYPYMHIYVYVYIYNGPTFQLLSPDTIKYLFSCITYIKNCYIIDNY